MPRPEWSFLMLPEDHKEVKWTQSFLQAKFTVWGQIIFGMVLVGMAISSVGTQVSGFFFVSLVSALFLTSLFLSLFFKPTVSAIRSLPLTPTAGDIGLYRVTVTNTGKTVIRNLEIFEHKLPYGLYALPEHPQQKTVVQWLEPKEQAVLTLALRIARRGSYVLEPLIAGTHFPTGLIRSIKTVTGRDPLIVFPKLLKLNDPALFLPHKFQAGGTKASSKFGQSNEFLSTREYREGDRPRDIHWNSSARAGKLIVKEYTNEYYVRVGLFLDTELKRFEKHVSFEARISLCGGIAEDFYKENYLVDLYLSGLHAPVVHTGGGRDQFSHLLEMLSAVEGEEHVDFSQSVAAMKEQSPGMSGFVLFLKDWDEVRAAFVKTIKELNVPTRVIIIRDRSLSLAVNDPTVSVYTPKELNYKI